MKGSNIWSKEVIIEGKTEVGYGAGATHPALGSLSKARKREIVNLNVCIVDDVGHIVKLPTGREGVGVGKEIQENQGGSIEPKMF